MIYCYIISIHTQNRDIVDMQYTYKTMPQVNSFKPSMTPLPSDNICVAIASKYEKEEKIKPVAVPLGVQFHSNRNAIPYQSFNVFT